MSKISVNLHFWVSFLYLNLILFRTCNLEGVYQEANKWTDCMIYIHWISKNVFGSNWMFLALLSLQIDSQTVNTDPLEGWNCYLWEGDRIMVIVCHMHSTDIFTCTCAVVMTIYKDKNCDYENVSLPLPFSQNVMQLNLFMFLLWTYMYLILPFHTVLDIWT